MTEVEHLTSLRDPAGYLVECGDRLIRVIRPGFVDTYRPLLSSSWLLEQRDTQALVGFSFLEPGHAAKLVGASAAGCLCLEHVVVGFPSFPCEWPLEMLRAAADHTLKLCLSGLKHGIGLKDATPFNILFRGAMPVFVDILSFERRDSRDPIWLAYGQFVRSFLLPALLDSRYGIDCHTHFVANRDGIEPEDAYSFLSFLARCTPTLLRYVTIPVLLSSLAEQRSGALYVPKSVSDPSQATYILQSLFGRLTQTVQSSTGRKGKPSGWSSYTDFCTYSTTAFDQKTAFLVCFLQSSKPARVLDVGCNTGHFSLIAARHGAEVVAIDSDPTVIGNLWLRASKAKANILPLVVNLARPTPALGWRNRETPSFLQRAEGRFDAVFMLAVVHHFLLTEQIPLDQIVLQAARLTTNWLVIEYIGSDDEQFKRLLRGREAIYNWFNRQTFENEIGRCFKILRREEIISSGRWLYLAQVRHAT